MIDKKVEDMINSLIQLDIDTSFAYISAINAIEQEDIAAQLEIFRIDHERHIRELGALLKEMGGTPLNYKQDLGDYIIEGMTSLRGMSGTLGALNAMLYYEMHTHKKYAKIIKNKKPPKPLRNLLTNNYSDEIRHSNYIEKKVIELEKMGIRAESYL